MSDRKPPIVDLETLGSRSAGITVEDIQTMQTVRTLVMLGRIADGYRLAAEFIEQKTGRPQDETLELPIETIAHIYREWAL